MKYDKEKVVEIISTEKVIGIIREKSFADLLTRAKGIIDGGVKVLEIALNSEMPFDAISSLNETYGDDILLGAGTVFSASDGAKALFMGAKFLVSPVFVEEVYELTKEKGVLYIAGAMTPAEIYGLKRKNLEVIKLFPANFLGTKYLKDIKGPFDDVKFIPFAGITEKNAKEWLNAGAIAVAVGASLTTPDKNKCDCEKIKNNAVKFLSAIKK